MDEKRRSRLPAVGGSSLLVMFAVLCLTVFALLGLSAVRAGGRLSEASAESVAAYYAADRQAETLFARLRSGDLPEEVLPCPCGGTEGYAYTCPISSTQQLCVEIHHENGEWTVVRWQAESIASWEEEEASLGLWDGTWF